MSKSAGRFRGKTGYGLIWAAGLGLLCGSAVAATKQQNMAGFRAEVAAARQVVAACAANAAGCNAESVPADSQVAGEAGWPGFHAGWDWLRDAVSSAKKESAQKRVDAMGQAENHLSELAAEAGGERPADVMSFQRARQTADTVLARGEFQAAEGPSWLDRQIAKFEDWLSRVFLGMENVGAHNPWIAPLIEWTLFGLAAAGLVIFVRRSLARQALRIALSETAVARRGGRDATDWAKWAEERAAAGDWRDAVHCLYWAGILSLETRQAWRPNPTRTPREYLRLLRPGSEAQRLLRDLTTRFERAWYGRGEVDQAAYRAAFESFEALRTAELRRAENGSAGLGTGLGAAAGAA